jgi:hypothetical protein
MDEQNVTNDLDFEKAEESTEVAVQNPEANIPDDCTDPRVFINLPVRYVMTDGDNDSLHYQSFLDGIRALFLLLDVWQANYDVTDPKIPATGLVLWVSALQAQHRALVERGCDFFGNGEGKVGFCDISDGMNVMQAVLKNTENMHIDGADEVLWCAERCEEHRGQIVRWTKEWRESRKAKSRCMTFVAEKARGV